MGAAAGGQQAPQISFGHGANTMTSHLMPGVARS
jgi:hypothetical protein